MTEGKTVLFDELENLAIDLFGFHYTDDLIISSDLVNYELEGCSCFSDFSIRATEEASVTANFAYCKWDSCACLKRNVRHPLFISQQIIDTLKSKRSSVPFVYQCSPHCKCGLPNTSCGLVSTKFESKLPLEVFKTERCGWGVRNTEPIKAGKFISTYSGEAIGADEAVERSKKRRKDNYILVLREVLSSASAVNCFFIDARNFGNIGRFFNHSCDDGNLVCIPIYRGYSIPDIGLFASQDIPAFTEMRYSYGSAKSQAPPDTSELNLCHCLSKECCGYLPFDAGILPSLTQKGFST